MTSGRHVLLGRRLSQQFHNFSSMRLNIFGRFRDSYVNLFLESKRRETLVNKEVISHDDGTMEIRFEPSPVMEELNKSRKTKESCDTLILIDGSKGALYGHRTVLAALSPFFEAATSERWNSTSSDQQKDKVDLRGYDITPGTIESVLNFAYSSSFKAEWSEVSEILSAAELLQINKQLADACFEYYEKALNAETFLDTHSIAIYFDSNGSFPVSVMKLKDKVKAIAVANFSALSSKDDFCELDPSAVIDIISDDALNVNTEEDVFRFVLKWFKHDKDKRRPFLQKVLSQVRLVHLDFSLFVDLMEEEGLASTCKELIEEVTLYHTKPSQRSEVLSSICRNPRGLPP